jgi:hypothetical protein
LDAKGFEHLVEQAAVLGRDADAGLDSGSMLAQVANKGTQLDGLRTGSEDE